MTTETACLTGYATSAPPSRSPGKICVVRVCIVYDCLYPYTIGGAERWYRNLAERLAERGAEVTFLTRRQWERGRSADVPGVRVVAVAPRMELYAGGRRRIIPTLVFGVGVLAHLIRAGRDYDIVHTASFPYFSLLAAAATRKRGGFQIVVDWHELWTREYWREYLGPFGGRIGWLIQRACLGVPQRAFCFSRLHERRLREQRVCGPLTRLEGEFAGDVTGAAPRPARLVVVFAGRHIPEKRVPALVPAIVAARGQIPELHAEIYGDGPQRGAVLRAIADEGAGGFVVAPGFVPAAVLDEALATALCLVLPSRREGYGLVVVEAAARAVPVVTVSDPDNAAAELVEEGVNGAIAASAEPHELAAAIVRVHRAGSSLRASAGSWFRENAERLSFDASFERVLEAYAEA
jgi:glycosyltransferase involved in cell wall biosynthesis